MSTTSQARMEKIKKAITPNREKYLRSVHRRLREAAKSALRAEHGRFDFFDYLELVLKTYWSWKDKGKDVRIQYRRQFGALFDIPRRKGLTSLHYLIQATSHGNQPLNNAETKRIAMRDSRWVQGLRFAAGHRSAVEKQGLQEFCYAKKRGGIAGCAKLFASMQKSKKSAKRVKRTKIHKASVPLLSGGGDWDDDDQEG
jgi:hypothetical protein